MRIITSIQIQNESGKVVGTSVFTFISDDDPDMHTIRLLSEDYKNHIQSMFGDQSKDTE